MDLAISANGMKMAAASSNGFIYVSIDGGTTPWTQQTSMGFKNWRSMDFSADGANIAAVEYQSLIWRYSGVPLGTTRDNLTGNCLCDNGAFLSPSCTLQAPNLTPSAPTPTTATVGTPQAFTATITNNGDAPTGAGFNNFFQVASQSGGSGTITDKTSSSMTTLAVGATQNTTVSHTFNTAGTYSIRVCADKSSSSNTGTITESNEDDNCSVWVDIIVTQPPPSTPTGLSAAPSTCGNNWLNLSWNASV
jgi:hypothetical protein